MPDSYYDSIDDESSPSKAEGDEMGEGRSKSDKDDSDDQQTALLPKSMFHGHKCKVGDIKKMKVVAIFDDEYEVAYQGKDDKSDDKDSKKSDDDSEDMKHSMNDLDEAYS